MTNQKHNLNGWGWTPRKTRYCVSKLHHCRER